MKDNQFQTLKSLWAELILIGTARNQEYLIQYWHTADCHSCTLSLNLRHSVRYRQDRL